MERKGYAEEQTINYYQVDQKGTLSPAALLSALQNAAIDHSDTLGYTLDYLAELQCGWAVINWHIMVYRMPAHRETIRLETWSNKCRKMQAERGYYLFDEKGEKIADGMSRWIYMDFAKRKPTNVPDDMIEKYGTNQPPAIEWEKFRMPPMPEGEPAAQQRFIVTRRDTDTNGHANNVKYLEWALDDVPDEIYDGMTLKDIRVVYRKECRRGDVVHTKTFVEEKDGEWETITFIFDEEETVLTEIAILWA